MVLDLSTIDNLLKYLEAQIIDLEKLDINREILEEDRIQTAAIKYILQTTVEAAINIGEHLVSVLNLGFPETNKEVFKILGREKIIDQALSEKLQKAAGMRNILVHNYLEVDLNQIANATKYDIKDLKEFAKQINGFLVKQPHT